MYDWALQPGGFIVPPNAPNYMGAAEQQAGEQNALLNQQTQANRPNQFNPYASVTWSTGPDGRPVQSSQFTGPMGDLNRSLQQQALQAMGTPFSLSGLPQLSTGQEARDQAISSAYGQATSRLDPAFSQREDALRTRLVNQGLQPGSEAYNREVEQLGRERTDAYGNAMANAVAQGTSAGSALFNQSLAGRQQALEEALRQRGQAFSEIQAMNPMLGQQGFNTAGQGQAVNRLGAAGMQGAADLARWNLTNQNLSDIFGAGTQLLGQGASMLPFVLSDERAKVDVRRLNEEVLPGVPAVVFRYRPDIGEADGLRLGVIAQDLQRVMPEAVRQRADGLLEVHPTFTPLPLE